MVLDYSAACVRYFSFFPGRGHLCRNHVMIYFNPSATNIAILSPTLATVTDLCRFWQQCNRQLRERLVESCMET